MWNAVQRPSRTARGRHGVLALVLSLALLAAAAPAAAQPGEGGPPGGSVTLRDGVVVDATRSTLYLMNPQGGIDAVDVESGQTLWTSTAAAKPLDLTGTRLTAQVDSGSGHLDVAVLDTRNEGEVRRTARLALPEGVRAFVDEGLGVSFRTRVPPQPAGANLAWAYLERSVRAIPSAPEAVERTGAFLFDPASGQATPLSPEATAELPGPPFPDLPPGQQLAGVVGRQFISADGRHVLASEPIADRVWLRYRWRIYERHTGELLGEIEHPASMAPFLVVGSQILYETRSALRREGEQWIEEPLAIRAAVLLSGFELYSLPVRDTRYLGPFPP